MFMIHSKCNKAMIDSSFLLFCIHNMAGVAAYIKTVIVFSPTGCLPNNGELRFT